MPRIVASLISRKKALHHTSFHLRKKLRRENQKAHFLRDHSAKYTARSFIH
jgi:hypothetical protein